jgi:hypothetical protein
MVAQKVTHGELDQKEYHRHFFQERVVSLDGSGLRCVLYQAHGVESYDIGGAFSSLMGRI